VKVVVVGGGIAGLAAAHRLARIAPDAELTLVERDRRLGGKLVTEHDAGYVVEGAADSFLSRKPRGIGLVEELGLTGELVGRRPEHARSFVRRGEELHPLPEGLTGMIPTDLDALEDGDLLSPEGRQWLAAEVDLPPEQERGDESIASFVSRRLGREAYERLVEPLMTGIYGGDGEQLSLQATFPNLRSLELEHGSVLRGLRLQSPPAGEYPPFVSFRDGMGVLVDALAATLSSARVLSGRAAVALRRPPSGWEIELDGGDVVDADGVVLAVPAFVVAALFAELDPELAAEHAAIPYASSAIVTLAYPEDVHSLDGYGYLVPRAEGSDVLACTWSSSKWDGRAADGRALIRVYVGRFGARDVTTDSDEELVMRAREELRILEITAEPERTWIHRWPRGMPQYVLGHPGRLERIEAALERHPGLALAGAAYCGVGIPDCIHSGEEAARALARAVAGAAR
jgi:protoporphyrinogen/coproporphyrinogen III oxidase